MSPARSTRYRILATVGALVASLATMAAALAGPLGSAARDDFSDKFLMLGTGSVGGAFRPIGESLCDAVNEDRRGSLVRCVPVGTAGTVFNLHAVVNGSIQLGIAQEDIAAEFFRNRSVNHAGDLRVIALLHNSPIVVMAHKSAGVTELSQIRGKTLNMGNRGSGQFAIATSLLKALDLKPEDFAALSYMPTVDFERAFCERKVDVVLEAVAHPSALFQKLRACGGEFVEITPGVVSRLIADNPRLAPMVVSAGTYAGQERDVKTLGMRNVLVTSASVDEEAVFRLASTVRRRYEQLKSEQPMLGSMALPDTSQAASLPVPLHAGALRALAQKSSSLAQ
jgi:TRAP transporter TAXI family solute receptor